MRVLVVDDDEAIRTAIRRALALDGHDVVLAEDGSSALEILRDSPPDAMVLDGMLPDIDGLEVCRRTRAAGDTVPILMLTARGAIGDKVHGLDAGADDYVVKPFDIDELLARLRALLRRALPNNSTVSGSRAQRLSFEDIVLDLDACTARRGTRTMDLTRTETALLELFMRHPGIALGRDRIMSEIWGYDFAGSNNLDVYISYLRRKTEVAGSSRVVQTVRGVGYVLRAEET